MGCAEGYEESEEMGPEGIYSGDMKKGVAEGRGVLKVDDFVLFEGRWSRGRYHGEGKESNLKYIPHNESIYIQNL